MVSIQAPFRACVNVVSEIVGFGTFMDSGGSSQIVFRLFLKTFIKDVIFEIIQQFILKNTTVSFCKI